MAFHPRYWTEPVKNSSNEYNYYEWNATSRKDAAKHVKSDTRKQPKPLEEIELDPQVRDRHASRWGDDLLRRATPLIGAEHDRARRGSASISGP